MTETTIKTQTNAAEDTWLSAQETCEILGVSPRTLNRWVQDRIIPEFAIKAVLLKGRLRKRYKALFINKIKTEKTIKQINAQDKKDNKNVDKTPIKFNDLCSHLVKNITDSQQSSTNALLKMHQDHIQTQNELSELKAKNAVKKIVLIFMTFLFLGIIIISAWTTHYLHNKNQAIILENKNQLEKAKKEAKEILRENMKLENNLQKAVSQTTSLVSTLKEKEAKIQSLEQKIEYLELGKEDVKEEDTMSLSLV